MREIDSHRQYVADNPGDRVAALALVDHAQEQLQLGRVAALRWVAQLTHPARRAAELAAAASWYSARSMLRGYLQRTIHNALRMSPGRGIMVVIVEGHHRPRIQCGRVVGRPRTRYKLAVTVGASWVLLQVAYWFSFQGTRTAILRAKAGCTRFDRA